MGLGIGDWVLALGISDRGFGSGIEIKDWNMGIRDCDLGKRIRIGDWD